MNRESGFSSKVGVVLATAGSAVGLGNIWKFSYILGQDGGGAFLVMYIICVFLLGMPLILSEFILGKHTHKNIVEAFRQLTHNNHWQWVAYVSLLCCIMLLSFYSVATGWCFEYLYYALTNIFENSPIEDIEATFQTLTTQTYKPVIWAVVSIVVTSVILWLGITKGIEKVAKILMPILLIILLVLVVNSLMLPESFKGMRFLFKPDFSKLTPSVLLDAMGQCFFSLSIGMGVLITYGSYMPKGQNLIATTQQVITIDTIVAILAGLAIFPAVFSFNIDPAEGPKLVFVVLPKVFSQMNSGHIWGILFFLLIVFAAITSVISMLEVCVSILNGLTSLSRHKSIVIMSLICCATASLCALSQMEDMSWLNIAGTTLFDWCDILTSHFLMPLSAMITAIFIGWFFDSEDIHKELASTSIRGKQVNKVFIPIFIFLIRWIVPILIIVVFLRGIDLI